MARTREALEQHIGRRCRAARERLEKRAGLAADSTTHFRRLTERPFTAAERDTVTVLFGGLTARHERVIEAVLQAAGHRCQALPQPDLTACLIGKAYCNNGVCNPAYFTVGSLVKYLQQLEASGMSRQDVIDKYVFFTAGSCGPCRFGMYESEYRIALRNAGFEGFRVLLFQQEHGVRADTGEPGLKLSLHLGLGTVAAFNFADALQGFGYAIRPYEVVSGLTNQRLDEATELVAAALRASEPARAADQLPRALWTLVKQSPLLAKTAHVLVNMYTHLYGPDVADTIRGCRAALEGIEVDRLLVKPVVKVTGEFWAQTTEGDGNFRMFSFLEREGAHVLVEPLGGWVLYLVQYARAQLLRRRGVGVPHSGPVWSRLRARYADEMRIVKRWLLLELGERIYRGRYERLRHALGDGAHPLVDQRELARLADPYYRQLARGGEGHLEVAKNIYYTTHRAAHMVLSLKPFGCMPSTQSDGVQSAVIARFKDMLYVPVETAAEGELGAHSRVQMALVEARARAQAEFERALACTGRRLEDIRAYVADHPELRGALYRVPRQRGVAGVAANFILHVGRLMKRSARTQMPVSAAREAAP
ncbi:MAG: activator of (R)-2-hydroxyglutaryl-CoA dehydratase [Acidobacteria bacterium]|nr:activator of (R)-2-hydroxyglutaryl-CoA dehydratase [Acidobacteriota bacterium]